jgi:Mlc titration factor MtfA (ptsG expression regulator)
MANPYGSWLVLLLAAIAAGAAVAGLLGLRARARRRRLRAAPLPRAWAATLERVLDRYPRMPAASRDELHGRVNEFIADKQIAGCGGLELNDGMRVTIAANACLLLLHRNVPTFPNVRTVLVYPTAFVAEFAEDEEWLRHEFEEVRAGESWDGGPLVLAWDEVLADAEAGDDRNVILHEFAHKLDEQNPDGDGLPPLGSAEQQARWAQVMQREYATLRAAADRGLDSLIDPYGAESPAEFFAVITETFFTQPLPLQRQHPQLYRALRDCFRSDPASWAPPP